MEKEIQLETENKDEKTIVLSLSFNELEIIKNSLKNNTIFLEFCATQKLDEPEEIKKMINQLLKTSILYERLKKI